MTDVLADRYRVKRQLGAGGMAVVFLAEDLRLRRDVAVKRLHAERPEQDAARLRREAKIGASLSNANLVTIYDIVADPHGVLVIMEYVEGETLSKRLRRGPMEPDEALPILRGVAAALDHAHAQDVVHRDVKPGNVLLAPDGTVKVADLGIALAADFTRVTQSGAIVGTPTYMAPEQLDGRAATPASDVYALATMAYEMLTGAKPRTGDSPLALALATQKPPPDIRDALPGVPAAVAAALRDGMAVEPERRPVSAGAFVEALESGFAEVDADPDPTERLPEPAPPPPAPPRREPRRTPAPAPAPRRRALLPLLALLAVLLAGGALVAVLATGGDDDGGGGGRASASTERGASQSSTSDSTTPEPTTSEPSAPAPTDAGPSTPEGAVRAFYERAADGDPEASFEVATPAARNQVGGLEAFRSATSTLERIIFDELSAEGDTVTLRTTAQHTDRVDRCQGTAQTVKEGTTYKVAGLDVSCAPG